MLTEEELASIKKFNIKNIEKGIEQAEARLNDESKKRQVLDEKAENLCSKLVSVLTVFLGAMNFIYKESMSNFEIKVSSIILITSLVASIMLLLIAMRSRKYGRLGKYPSTWLEKAYLEDNEETNDYYYGFVMTGILIEYHNRIHVSHTSNDKKELYINLGQLTILYGFIAASAYLIFTGFDIDNLFK